MAVGWRAGREPGPEADSAFRYTEAGVAPPWASGPKHVQHAIEKASVVMRRTAAPPALRRQERTDHRPLRVRKVSPIHTSLRANGLDPSNWSDWDANFRARFGSERSAQMPKKRFTDEQIAFALRQAEAGTNVGEICRQLGISEVTFYLYGRLSHCK